MPPWPSIRLSSHLRIYARALRISEAVGNYRAGDRPVSSARAQVTESSTAEEPQSTEQAGPTAEVQTVAESRDFGDQTSLFSNLRFCSSHPRHPLHARVQRLVRKRRQGQQAGVGIDACAARAEQEDFLAAVAPHVGHQRVVIGQPIGRCARVDELHRQFVEQLRRLPRKSRQVDPGRVRRPGCRAARPGPDQRTASGAIAQAPGACCFRQISLPFKSYRYRMAQAFWSRRWVATGVRSMDTNCSSESARKRPATTCWHSPIGWCHNSVPSAAQTMQAAVAEQQPPLRVAGPDRIAGVLVRILRVVREQLFAVIVDQRETNKYFIAAVAVHVRNRREMARSNRSSARAPSRHERCPTYSNSDP